MDQEAPAGRRDALGFGQARAVGRPSPDGPSRPGDGRRGTRANAGGRAGLRPHRRALSPHGRPGRAGRAGTPAAPARMDRRRRPARACRRPASPSALGALHRPRRPGDIDPAGPAATRLAYDELLANQLALLMMRARMRDIAGPRACQRRAARRGAIDDALPFALDRRAGAGDRRNPRRSRRAQAHDAPAAGRRRLGQDDRRAARDGRRRRGRAAGGADGADRNSRPPAFRAHAPARRSRRAAHRAHHRPRQGRPSAARRWRRWRRAKSTSPSARTRCSRRASAFRDLGLAVVDEQHRFGVHQRLALAGKGEAVDLLVMTATPIPRTLVLAYFGDMDVSALTREAAGPPADRHPRHAARAARRGRRRIGRAIAGARAPIGSARWSRRARRSTSRRRKSARRRCARFSATPSAWCTAA